MSRWIDEVERSHRYQHRREWRARHRRRWLTEDGVVIAVVTLVLAGTILLFFHLGAQP